MTSRGRFFVHPTALVESDAIGDGTRIWAFCHVMDGASIGGNCNIGDHSFIESGAVVGNDVTVKNGNMIWEGVEIADGAFLGPNVLFTNDLQPRSPRLAAAAPRYQDRAWLLPTVVGRGASIGAGAVILAGVTIGAYAMVGAGAVVTREVIRHALVVGNPARPHGWVCECGALLQVEAGDARCSGCARTYRASPAGLERVTERAPA